MADQTDAIQAIGYLLWTVDPFRFCYSVSYNESQSTMPDTSYIDFATSVARQAGYIMLEHFQIGIAADIKTDGSPVTAVDKAINSLVIQAVAERFPDHSVSGEEESSTRKAGSPIWMCDPLDGTIPYMYGIPTNVFSLALVEDGQPRVAVVYDPYTKRMFRATQGEGAHVNDQPIRVNNQLLQPGQAIGFSRGSSKTLDTVRLYAALRAPAKNMHVFALHSAVYGAMMVAAGQFTAYIHGGNHPEDAAALKLIVEEAGGKVTDLSGHSQRYDQPVQGIVASNGIVHQELLELVADCLFL